MATPISQTQPDANKPHVLIVGAGLAGLLLGVLLDKQGVSYEIFERSSKVRPLGKWDHVEIRMLDVPSIQLNLIQLVLLSS